MNQLVIRTFALVYMVIGLVAGPFLNTSLAADQEAVYAPIELKNATYTIEAVVNGDDEISTIQTPTSIFVKEQKATLVVNWDSTDYNYMVVGGETILPKSREDGCIFWIPVTAWDEEMPVLVNRGTGNTEDLSCSLYLDTSTIKKQGNMGPLYFLIILNIVLAFLNGWNMIRKRNLYAERVETEKEAAKFAKQQEKKPAPVYQPQRRLVLDENGNFVTSDVFESAKQYKAQNGSAGAGDHAAQNPSAGQTSAPKPPQDAPAPQLWWRRTGEETLIIDRKADDYKVKEIRPVKVETKEETEPKENNETE